jgi:hypothetical protein
LHLKNEPVNPGTIGILIEYGGKVIGIEAKIWDKSAINKSKKDVPQLQRYCEYFHKEFTDPE